MAGKLSVSRSWTTIIVIVRMEAMSQELQPAPTGSSFALMPASNQTLFRQLASMTESVIAAMVAMSFSVMSNA